MANGTASVAVDRDIDDLAGVRLAAGRAGCWVLLNPMTDAGTTTAANERATQSFMMGDDGSNDSYFRLAL